MLYTCSLDFKTMEFEYRCNMSDEDHSLAKQEFFSVLCKVQEEESWEEVFPTIRSNVIRADEVEAQFQNLLDRMLSKGCKKRDAPARFAEVYCRWQFFYRCILFSITDEGSLDGFLTALWEYPEVIFVCELRYGFGSSPRMVSSAFDHTDVKFMQVIVTYGLTTSQEMCAGSFSELCYDIFAKFIPEGIAKKLSWISEVHIKLGRMCSRIYTEGGTRNDLGLPRGLNRVPHIVRSLAAVGWTLHSNEVEGEKYVRIQQAYLDTVPDPLVTPEEVRDFLLIDLKGKPEELAQTDIWVQAFTDLFGQPAFEPRSLSHLCRCKVREIIVKQSSVTLPAAVGRLRLPTKIKDFILCAPGWSLSHKP